MGKIGLKVTPRGKYSKEDLERFTLEELKEIDILEEEARAEEAIWEWENNL